MNPQFENHWLLCWSTDGIQKKGYLQTGNEWALDVKLRDKKPYGSVCLHRVKK